MIQFTDISEFHNSYQFFMFRYSRIVNLFIITIAFATLAVIIWSFVAKMDDMVKANALLRPATTISQIMTLYGGEVLEKNYNNDSTVTEGDLLIRLDATADLIDFENSKKLMVRLQEEMIITECLLETIKKNYNSTIPANHEAYIRSQAYLIEYKQLQNHIEELKTKLAREKALPESMVIAQRIEDMEKEITQARYSFDLWYNNKYIQTMDNIRNLSTEEETLERRLSDIERNIKNANIYAPISGRINEIRALNTGDYVLSGEQILNIIPYDVTILKAELYVDPAYVAQVKTGQKVSLRFPGLPPSKFGKLEAEVTIIPADYMIGPNAKPFFVVEATIDKPYLTARNGEHIPLRAGIGAEGRIIIAQDSVMNMILKKLDFISSTMDLLKDN